MEIDLIELFSGTGGFTKGLQEAGFTIKKHQFSEIDKHAIANYKYNFKNAEYIGSVKDIRGQRGKADIITFGSPCQDFSLSGKREGLEGQKSSLILEAIRLISEIKPSVFIWENVKGTFSSNNGADFWAILNAFTNIGGYRLEWQLLNTKWVLPQNRERIYLIGHLAGKSEPGVFPITETNRLYKESNEIEEKIHTNNRPVSLTQQARQYASWCGDFVRVWSPTKKGYEDCEIGDSINIGRITSKTRRGRVGKKQMQTLDTSCRQVVYTEKGIRAFTEIEIERAQGFPDDWTKYGNYDGEIKEIAKSQRYKLCGNAVSTQIVKLIGEKLKISKAEADKNKCA